MILQNYSTMALYNEGIKIVGSDEKGNLYILQEKESPGSVPVDNPPILQADYRHGAFRLGDSYPDVADGSELRFAVPR